MLFDISGYLLLFNSQISPNSAPNIPRYCKLWPAMSKEQEENAASDLVPLPSRFTKNEKWFIVGFIAFVGLFRQSFIMSGFEALPNWLHYSPLTSNIYLPAIPEIVVAFHKSTEFIYLSVRLLLDCLPNLPTWQLFRWRCTWCCKPFVCPKAILQKIYITSRWRNLTNSTHDLGHCLRLLWQTTTYSSMSTYSIPFMHRTCASTSIHLLVIDGSPVPTGRWVSQYHCNR